MTVSDIAERYFMKPLSLWNQDDIRQILRTVPVRIQYYIREEAIKYYNTVYVSKDDIYKYVRDKKEFDVVDISRIVEALKKVEPI